MSLDSILETFCLQRSKHKLLLSGSGPWFKEISMAYEDLTRIASYSLLPVPAIKAPVIKWLHPHANQTLRFVIW